MFYIKRTKAHDQAFCKQGSGLFSISIKDLDQDSGDFPQNACSLIYRTFLRENKNEEEHFINLLTTNKTSFFRTPRIWDFFSKEVIDNWDVSKPLNVWSAAASKGAEAYSIAIICKIFQEKNCRFNFSVLATDIDTEILTRARKGIFSTQETKSFSTEHPQLFNRFMLPDENGAQVKPEISGLVDIRKHNLILPLQQRFHVIFLRNVLIYFEKENQQTIINQVAKTLEPGGYLIIGESESISNIESNFRLVEPFVYTLEAS